MLRMTVEGVAFDHLRQTVVVLKDWEGKKLLPIWIGPVEAKAIAIEMEGARPGRPLSHDLLINIIATARGRITRVVINDLIESTFFATIDIDTPHGTRHIDSRPSDAIAVAVRAKCPVFVDGGALKALVDATDVQNLPAISAESGAGADEDAASPEENDEEVERFRRLLGEE